MSLCDLPKKKAAVFVQTIRKNMEGFTKQEVREANLVHKTQSILAHPQEREFVEIVSSHYGIANIPTCSSHIANANLLYGKDLGELRRRQVWFES